MCVCARELTVEEAVVFKAAAAEQRVEGVQALLPLHGASVRTVNVWRALRGQRAGQLLLCQLLIPDNTHRKPRPTISLTTVNRHTRGSVVCVV